MPSRFLPWILLLGLAGCASAPRPTSSSTFAPPVTAFVGVTVLPLDRERVLEGQTVIVQGTLITAVGPAATTRVPPQAVVIEGRGRILMPGLTDMHVHLVREEDLLLFLARGVTTVRNMWGAPVHSRWRELVEKGEMTGPRIVTGGPIMDGDPPDLDGWLVVRTEEEADQAVALHKRAGYDFLKVYSKLSPPVYARLLASGRKAGFQVAGHVPREVGLEKTIDGGQISIEHLAGFVDALQADDSPVAGKFDPESQSRKIEFVDEKKLKALVDRVKARGTFNCPTRSVMVAWAPAAKVRAELARPEMKYVPEGDRAIWEPGPDRPKVVENDRRLVALFDRIIHTLNEAGAKLVVGTDPGNPLVVSGFSVHDELQLLVKAGLSPYQALRAATVNAALLVGAAREQGTVAVGMRADLLLLEGNPLRDVSETTRIGGVMARGRFFAKGDLEKMLASVASTVDGKKDPFRGLPELRPEGARLFAAAYEVHWKDAFVGAERLVVEEAAKGQTRIRAQRLDVHKGQRESLRLELGAAATGPGLVLESDGSNGRGRVEIIRRGSEAELRGTGLPGREFSKTEPLPAEALLGAKEFVASLFLLAPRLKALEVGKALELRLDIVALGSEATLRSSQLRIERIADGTLDFRKTPVPVKRYALKPVKGPPSVLSLDEKGWPLQQEIQVWGTMVRIRRIE